MRYLGIDFGSKKVGTAVSDEAGTMGFPREIIPNNPQLLQQIADLCTHEGVGAIVIGESRDLQGNANPIAAEAKAFAEALSAKTGLSVDWEPEFFTTQEARRGPGQPDARQSRAPRDTDPVDASAAALILTSYLTRKSNTKP